MYMFILLLLLNPYLKTLIGSQIRMSLSLTGRRDTPGLLSHLYQRTTTWSHSSLCGPS